MRRGGGMRDYLFLGFAVFLFSAALSFFFFREREIKVSVTLAKVQFKDELPLRYQADSQLKPVKSWEVSARTSGKLDWLFAKAGDSVKKIRSSASSTRARTARDWKAR